MASSFLSWKVTHRDCLFCFIWVTLITLIQEGGLRPLRLLPLMTNSFVFMPLQGIAPGISWLGVVYLKVYKIIWEIKLTETKTKYYLATFILLCIKWTGMVEIKHKEFIDVAPIMHCQNSSRIMGLRVYKKGKTLIYMSSPTIMDPLPQDPG